MNINAILWIILVVAIVYVLARDWHPNPDARRTLNNMGRLSLGLLLIIAIPVVLAFIWVLVANPRYLP